MNYYDELKRIAEKYELNEEDKIILYSAAIKLSPMAEQPKFESTTNVPGFGHVHTRQW